MDGQNCSFYPKINAIVLSKCYVSSIKTAQLYKNNPVRTGPVVVSQERTRFVKPKPHAMMAALIFVKFYHLSRACFTRPD